MIVSNTIMQFPNAYVLFINAIVWKYTRVLINISLMQYTTSCNVKSLNDSRIIYKNFHKTVGWLFSFVSNKN